MEPSKNVDACTSTSILENYGSQSIEQQVEAFIKREVHVYLKPYFATQITEENQDINRKPIYYGIREKLERKFKKYQSSQLNLEATIFNFYITEAVADFTKKLLPIILNPENPAQEEQKKVFFRAVHKAMAYDFTLDFRLMIAYEQQIENVLHLFYEIRKAEREQSLNQII